MSLGHEHGGALRHEVALSINQSPSDVPPRIARAAPDGNSLGAELCVALALPPSEAQPLTDIAEG